MPVKNTLIEFPILCPISLNQRTTNEDNIHHISPQTISTIPFVYIYFFIYRNHN